MIEPSIAPTSKVANLKRGAIWFEAPKLRTKAKKSGFHIRRGFVAATMPFDDWINY